MIGVPSPLCSFNNDLKPEGGIALMSEEYAWNSYSPELRQCSRLVSLPSPQPFCRCSKLMKRDGGSFCSRIRPSEGIFVHAVASFLSVITRLKTLSILGVQPGPLYNPRQGRCNPPKQMWPQKATPCPSASNKRACLEGSPLSKVREGGREGGRFIYDREC